MRSIFKIAILVGMLACFSPLCRAGLYGDEGKNITAGDINDQDYWWTKFDITMLDLAIKQHQPEGRIGFNLASTKSRLDDLSKKYPQHEQINQWKRHVDEVLKQIDPNASRSEYFKPGCPWEESNFAQAWVNLNWAKMKIADKQLSEAHAAHAECRAESGHFAQAGSAKGLSG